jgi:hypothetical protein
MLSFTKLAALTGLFALTCSAFPADAPPQDPGKTPAPFNSTIGPNILVAVVKCVLGRSLWHARCLLQWDANFFCRTPDGRSEIDGWCFGYNWCSTSQKISSGKNICESGENKAGIEYLHVPLTDKFGDIMNYEYYNGKP